MKRTRRHKKSQPKGCSQCDSCEAKGCRDARQQECARLECMALAEGRIYECPDREPGYWERLEAA
jgi:hypothetical protein